MITVLFLILILRSIYGFCSYSLGGY